MNQIGYFMNVITSYVSHHNPMSYFEYVKRWVISPDWGLWFLWALFLIFVYFKLVDHFTNHDVKYGDVVAIIVAHVLIQLVPTGYFGIGFVKWFFLFFSTGYLYPKYVSKIPYKKLLKFIIPIIFVVLTYFWNRMSPPTIWESFVSMFANKPVPGLHHLLTIYQILVPMFGLLTAYILVPKQGGYIFRLFSYLGKNHSLFMHFIFISHRGSLLGIY